jgi:CDP-diacylglycerol--glycerol-3-phosphate 3-phosphatidyltransferase
VIALLILTGYSGMNPWLILPATVILFREVFVGGLREYLGEKAGLLKVTKLAKWKTSAQMLAIAVLFLGTGLEHMEGIARQGKTIEEYATLVAQGLADPIRSCGMRGCSSYATWAGLALVWFAAALTAITGWDYFRKSLPQLKD